MWEDVLMVGVTPSLKKGKRPFIWLHGRNEEGARRSWTCFANSVKRETTDDEGNTTQVDRHYFSGYLHLALGATVEKLDEAYTKFVEAIKNHDQKASEEWKNKLHDATERGAGIFKEVEDAMSANKIEEAREHATKVIESLNSMLVGRVLRLHWDDTQEYETLAKHACPIRRSLQDGAEVFGGREISEWLTEFEAGKTKTWEESVDDAYTALEDDREYEAEVDEARASKKPAAPEAKKASTPAPADSEEESKAKPAAKKSKAKAKQTVPQGGGGGESTEDDGSQPF